MSNITSTWRKSSMDDKALEERPRKDEENQLLPTVAPVAVREADAGLRSITVNQRASSGNGPQKPSAARKMRLLRSAFRQDACRSNRVDSSSDDEE